MINPHYVIFGAFLQLLGTTSYLVDTIKGKVKPNRVTWFIWAIVPSIALSAELSNRIGLVALMTFMLGFGPLLIFFASFYNRKSYWKLTKIDLICSVLAIIGLLLWQLTDVSNLAIFFSILADFFAWVPTFRKSFTDPESENWYYFLFDAISAGIALTAIHKWIFAAWGWPVWILLSCIVLVILIKFKIGIRIHMFLYKNMY